MSDPVEVEKVFGGHVKLLGAMLGAKEVSGD